MAQVTYRAMGTKMAAYRSYFTLNKTVRLGVRNHSTENTKMLLSWERTMPARGRLMKKDSITLLIVRNRKAVKIFSTARI